MLYDKRPCWNGCFVIFSIFIILISRWFLPKIHWIKRIFKSLPNFYYPKIQKPESASLAVWQSYRWSKKTQKSKKSFLYLTFEARLAIIQLIQNWKAFLKFCWVNYLKDRFFIHFSFLYIILHPVFIGFNAVNIFKQLHTCKNDLLYQDTLAQIFQSNNESIQMRKSTDLCRLGFVSDDTFNWKKRE